MATDAKPAAAASNATDSPEVAALKFKQTQLTEKLARLEAQEREMPGHDLANAKQRTTSQLEEVKAALKTAK